MTNPSLTLKSIMSAMKPPVLIVSSMVGRGNYSIGESFLQQAGADTACYHIAIEDFLPPSAVAEDLQRYKWISNNIRPLLYLIYTIPLFYYLKYARERWFFKTDLKRLEERVQSIGANTIICISHRPSFWMSLLKTRTNLDCALWGVLSEFGTNLGWRYIFWEAVNGFLSVLPREQLRLTFSSHLLFRQLGLPCRREFFAMAGYKPDKNNLLVAAGYWGQVGAAGTIKLIEPLLKVFPDLKIHLVCGTNSILEERLNRHFSLNEHIRVYGRMDSLAGFMHDCAAIITKPGFSTLIEAHAASRKIFLLRGMPVAEDHNARHAIGYFSAEWFNLESFKRWYDAY
ncbi:MAG: hypothetical protein KGK03_10025 [Candidatus Omnitrophica bacterium]|nr:hypothetical protein [Candidatus Omnitrophota bacterium]MDE2223389.1 hypothetical protein [Candidatus Omnitrophota bacterium]